jgi:uncharacterized protein (TIGR00369 family)
MLVLFQVLDNPYAVPSRIVRRETMRYLERVLGGDPEANPFFAFMGIEVAGVEKGKASLRMRVREEMHNGVGWMQGGIFTALADEAMALAMYPLLADGEDIATISENTSFFKGVRAGGVLFAEGRVIRKGRRVAFAEGDVREGGPGGHLLSRTAASFAVVKNGTGP